MENAMPRLSGVFALCLLAMVLLAVPSFAQNEPQAAPQVTAGAGQASQSEFVPVKDLPQSEQLPSAPLLMTAYAFVWVVLLVYLWSIWRRLHTVEGEMKILASRLNEKSERR